jgi:hypothetical protein
MGLSVGVFVDEFSLDVFDLLLEGVSQIERSILLIEQLLIVVIVEAVDAF